MNECYYCDEPTETIMCDSCRFRVGELIMGGGGEDVSEDEWNGP